MGFIYLHREWVTVAKHFVRAFALHNTKRSDPDSTRPIFLLEIMEVLLW